MSDFQSRKSRPWVRAGINGGMTRSSNPLLKQSASGSRAADPPKPQLRPFTLSKNYSAGWLSMTRVWGMTVNIERQVKIPPHITQSKLRPNIILVSAAKKQLFLLGLKVPWKERALAGADTPARACVSAERMENQMYASGGGQSGICQSLPEQNLWHTGHNRCHPKKSNNVEDAEKASTWL